MARAPQQHCRGAVALGYTSGYTLRRIAARTLRSSD
jgi:hypothetical protein